MDGKGRQLLEIFVRVRPDHLNRLAWGAKPIMAVAELIWNALDADATEVHASFDFDALDTLQGISVSDNGDGIAYGEVEDAFGNLGGSWKRDTAKSRTKKRLLHGRAGKGRFRAFALGSVVEWHTRFADNKQVLEYDISGYKDNLGTFKVGDVRECIDGKLGTEVKISDVSKNFALCTPKAVQEITEQFALYLRTHPDVGIWYNKQKIDPSIAVTRMQNYDMDRISLNDGQQVSAKLTIIEWNIQAERHIYLCDAAGFPLERTKPGIHASGFTFSAYLKSDFLKELDDRNCLVLEDMNPDFQILMDATKKKLREYFRERSAEQARDLVEEWKKEEVYPYEGQAQDILDRTRRQVFDVIALNVNTFLPDFESSDKKSRKFAFRLIREALEDSPDSLQRILRDVLELPQKQQEELAQLLERTSLSAIINASKIVSDRLDFLVSLEMLVFDPESKKLTKERSQLHKILENETWVFGEEYFLSASDKSLDEVLCRHLKLLGRDVSVSEHVEIEGQARGIVDLMLSRKVRSGFGEELHHLVVELKRPSQKINDAACNQVRKYAVAVGGDEQFSSRDTKWSFWVVSNEMTRDARMQAKQRDKPVGLLFDSDVENLEVWARTWGEIITSCRNRLKFFQEQLSYSADSESALAYLSKLHAEYLPEHIAENIRSVSPPSEIR